MDKTAVNSGDYSTTTDTGTTATASQSNELWIGGTTACSSLISTQTGPTQGFSLFDGAAESYTYGNQSIAYLEKIVSSTEQAHSGTTAANNSNWSGCIATFKVSGDSTIVVPYDGRYAGDGSKQTVIFSSADPIISVQSNLSDITKSAVIENLVIWGSGNNTGIRLENVYNCLIRNVTLVNCYWGIKLTATGSGWTQSNRIEHVRMAWVTHGIEFVPGGTNDFGFTHIDDVGISLKNEWMQTGIVIGQGCKPYSSFIKATVWSQQTGRGMYVDGEIKYCLINLTHEKSGSAAGYGVEIGQNASIGSNNQSFFVAAGNLSSPVHNPYSKAHDIVSKTY